MHIFMDQTAKELISNVTAIEPINFGSCVARFTFDFTWVSFSSNRHTEISSGEKIRASTDSCSRRSENCIGDDFHVVEPAISHEPV